jgi:hypothetical protein
VINELRRASGVSPPGRKREREACFLSPAAGEDVKVVATRRRSLSFTAALNLAAVAAIDDDELRPSRGRILPVGAKSRAFRQSAMSRRPLALPRVTSSRVSRSFPSRRLDFENLLRRGSAKVRA